MPSRDKAFEMIRWAFYGYGIGWMIAQIIKASKKIRRELGNGEVDTRNAVVQVK